MSWTDLKVSKLKELWTKGHTASEIAGMLGETTRNAVIGKAHRLNLEERAPSKAKSGSEKKQINNSQPKLKGSVSRKSKFNYTRCSKEGKSPWKGRKPNKNWVF